MDVNDLKGLYAEVTKRMKTALDHLQHEFGGVRTGRASQLGAIEKAIRSAGLGLNPANDGKIVRIPLPSLTEERRRELSKHVHKLSEEGRNVIRQVRRDANDRLKKLLKDHQIPEDDEKKGLDEIQKLTDNHIKLIDDLQKKKDGELLGK
jgi:ribosome recycling factor